MFLVWAYRGKHAGQFVPMPTEAAVQQAEAEGWAQDARHYAAHQLRAVEADEPARYETRVMVADEPRRYETKGERRGKHR
jgi:hypothetical protein